MMITLTYRNDDAERTYVFGYRSRAFEGILALSVFIGTIAAGIRLPIIEYIELSKPDNSTL